MHPYKCIYTHTHVNIYIYIYIYIYILICIHISVCVCVCIYIYIYIYRSEYVWIYIEVHIYAYILICLREYICISIYSQWQNYLYTHQFWIFLSNFQNLMPIWCQVYYRLIIIKKNEYRIQFSEQSVKNNQFDRRIMKSRKRTNYSYIRKHCFKLIDLCK